MKEKDAVRKAFSKNKDAYIISSTHSTGSDLSLLKEWINPPDVMSQPSRIRVRKKAINAFNAP